MPLGIAFCKGKIVFWVADRRFDVSLKITEQIITKTQPQPKTHIGRIDPEPLEQRKAKAKFVSHCKRGAWVQGTPHTCKFCQTKKCETRELRGF